MKTKKTTKPLDFIELYERFITESERGKRVQPNGKKINFKAVYRFIHFSKLREISGSDKIVGNVKKIQ